MTIRVTGSRICVVWLLLLCPSAAGAQILEAVGTRAQGMGGAFVAVANDSSATWWNPAGLADGPFFDASLGRAVSERAQGLPAARDRGGWVALATPVLGVSYHRLRVTDIQPFDNVAPGDGREDRRPGVPVRSLAAGQYGVTILRTLVQGVHAGTTLKYVRGTVHGSREDGARTAGALLDTGAALDAGGVGGHAFDLDAGLLAVAGPVRLGGVVKNLRAPRFGGADGVSLPRQARVGAAVDLAAAGGPALTLAVDADVRAYRAGAGERRMVAAGAEQWLFGRRLAIRGGLRANTVGSEERTGTAGASVAPRAGLFVDLHVAAGGDAAERGWGLSLRTSF